MVGVAIDLRERFREFCPLTRLCPWVYSQGKPQEVCPI